MRLSLNNLDDLDFILAQGRKMVNAGHACEVEIRKKTRRRTLTQNAAMHKYFELLAGEMNDAGVTIKTLVAEFKEGFEVPVTEEFLKTVFRLIGQQMYGVDSTAKLDTKQVQEVYLTFDQGMAKKTGVTVAWPSREPEIP